jgi:hypothetical protein
MRYRGIEVDEEIFNLLKKKAEPLVDTPNSVLRRLLLNGEGGSALSHPDRKTLRESDVTRFPAGVPAALRETLEVARLVINGSSRPSATQMVAKKYNIAPQTVLDKYCRQLNLKASEFDELLDQPGRPGLMALLIQKFPRHGEIIRKYLSIKAE